MLEKDVGGSVGLEGKVDIGAHQPFCGDDDMVMSANGRSHADAGSNQLAEIGSSICSLKKRHFSFVVACLHHDHFFVES